MESTDKILPVEIVEKVKDALQMELLKRGFLAPITVEEELTRRGDRRLTITSEPFQTVPVIMKELRISEFGSWILPEMLSNNEGEEIPSYRIVINVHVSYTHFGGGSNGTSLFRFECYYYPESYHGIGDIKID